MLTSKSGQRLNISGQNGPFILLGLSVSYQSKMGQSGLKYHRARKYEGVEVRDNTSKVNMSISLLDCSMAEGQGLPRTEAAMVEIHNKSDF